MRSFSAIVLVCAASSALAGNSNRHQSRAVDTPATILTAASTEILPQVNAVISDALLLSKGGAPATVYTTIQASLINIQNILHSSAVQIIALTPVNSPTSGTIKENTQTLFGLAPIVGYLTLVTSDLQAISATQPTLTAPIDAYANNVTSSFVGLLKSVNLATTVGIGAGLSGLSKLISTTKFTEEALASVYQATTPVVPASA